MRFVFNTMLALGLIGTALAVFGHFLFGRVPISGDMTLFYAPFYALKWNAGPPLWNPYEACGMPMDGNLQFGLMYPLRWPFYFIADWRSYFSLYFFLHYLIAMLGTAGTLRAFGCGRWAMFGGAVAFACGGYMVGRMINSTIFLSSCWFPWLIWGAVERRAIGGIIAATGIAMILLLGSPHLMAYGTVGFAVAWLVMGPGWAGEKNPVPIPARRFGPWFLKWVYFALGVGVGLVNVLPALEPIRDSIREETNIAQNLQDSLRWSEILPSFFGGSGGVIYPENNDKTLFIGGAAMFLILVAALQRRAWRDRRWWCALAIAAAGLLLALGSSIGWQFVLPYIWGLNLLEGPARALVLTALGLALMAGCGVEALMTSTRRQLLIPVLCVLGGAGGVATFLMIRWPPDASFAEALREWIAAPGALIGRTFTYINTMLTLAAAGLIALAGLRHRVLAVLLLSLLIPIELWHFSPRVNVQTVERSSFDPPPSVRFLLDQRASAPFRIASSDPFRFHHTEMDSVYKVDYLMSNLAAIYGLEDISGFDPLINRDYKQLFARLAGIPGFNDPIRHLDPARPSEQLFKTLNVRYLIGNPYDRRVTYLPQTLTPGNLEAEVTAWNDGGTSAPLVAWNLVSLVDGRLIPGYEEEVAQLIVEAKEGQFTFPVRYGVETGYIAEPETPLSRMKIQTNMRWRRYPGPSESGYRTPQRNYRATIEFGRPLHVTHLRWRLTRPDLIFFVPAQGYRIAAPVPDPNWKLAMGDGPAPVYEFLGWSQRAVVGANSRIRGGDAFWPGEEELRAEIQRTARTANRLEYEVTNEEPGLFVLRESWSAGWKAKLDGQEVPLLRVNGLFRGLPLPAGRHEITMQYAPRMLYFSLSLSAMSLLVLLLVFGLTSASAGKR